MKRIVIVTFILVFLLFISAGSTLACTMVMVAKGDVMLAGNNEDWKDPDTKMWIYPATKDKYGRVCFGFGNGYTQGGMNDQGLFIDANALSHTGWKPAPGKPTFQGNLMDHILEHCATVNEAIAFFKKYNFPSLARAKFPIADARGESMVVEWGHGKLQCIKRTGMYQVSTNFVQTNYKPGDYPCVRYKISEKILRAAKEVSIGLVRSVLSATHSELRYPTLYSNICDLKNKIVYLYNFHNFEEAYVIDLAKELKKGGKTYDIPSLFLVKTQAARLFERLTSKPGSNER